MRRTPTTAAATISSNQQPPPAFLLCFGPTGRKIHTQEAHRGLEENRARFVKPWHEMQKIASSQQPPKTSRYYADCFFLFGRLVPDSCFLIFFCGGILLWILFDMDYCNILRNCLVFHPLYTTNKQGFWCTCFSIDFFLYQLLFKTLPHQKTTTNQWTKQNKTSPNPLSERKTSIESSEPRVGWKPPKIGSGEC